MELIPVKESLEENEEFADNPLCQEATYMTIEFYKKIGFVYPWIGYFVKQYGKWVGSGGFKGKPINGVIEIAYGVFEPYRKQGIGTGICKELLDLAIRTDPGIRIIARTLVEENFSGRILKKNNFRFAGLVNDPEDGTVCEWVFKGNENTKNHSGFVQRENQEK